MNKIIIDGEERILPDGVTLINLDDKLHNEIMNDLISNTDILDELKKGE